MKGYAAQHRTRKRLLRQAAAVGAASLVVFGVGACSLLDEAQENNSITIPSTDELQTETLAKSIEPSTTSRTLVSTTPTIDPADSIARAIRNATRVSTTKFHVGATSPTGTRDENVSGVHFSTPDRGVSCSVAHDNSEALVCVSEYVDGPESAPAGGPDGCDWNRNLLVLDSSNLAEGGCQNQYRALYRSTILEFGSAITVNRYSCLSNTDGLHCLESGSDRGFTVNRKGVTEIHADDRATDSSSSSLSPTPSR